ncbi:SAM-dependent methyltransferase [Croceivirga sp. JEA036]|uniref:SAM-dependent methyltransferase n=1 Tax=Croceivirga sp. JEA036 TaxID=2721162 RepID=UPI001439E29E|nr:SAM-dependent methyltransferase [Croceivirga sp. JEA036]NJB35888.1 SAM-dependent methyltransferase [Croceivirga sp. JEA036]
MNTTSPQGILYMIPTMLGDTAPLEVLPLSIKQTIENIDFYIAENEKTARRFIKRISPSKSQPSLHFQLLNKYTDPLEIPSFLDPCLEGTSVGLLSEAGCPGIADPGADVVKIAHEKGIQVVPLVGPSSILLALMASGMNGQSFAFNGYLPIDGAERGKALKKFEKLSKDIQQSQVFIETPYRNDKLFQEMLKKLHPDTRLCIGIDITLPTEYIVTKTILEWKKTSLDLQKRPAVFIIHSF